MAEEEKEKSQDRDAENKEENNEEKKESVPDEKEATTESSTGNGCWWKACAIVGMIIAVLLIGYFGLAWILRTLDETTPTTFSETSSTATSNMP